MALLACPTCWVTKINSHLFRVLLLRRLQLPLPLTARTCRCGRPLDSFGHHRTACARAGVLARRGTHWRASPARICREAGGRVSTNVFVRDLDLMEPGVADGRRLEVVVNGLPLFGGSQIAVDTTLVSALHCDGTPLRRAAVEDGVALTVVALRKSRTYPELVGPRARARLVVMGVEVGGRWAPETRTFLSLLARARARGESRLLQNSPEHQAPMGTLRNSTKWSAFWPVSCSEAPRASVFMRVVTAFPCCCVQSHVRKKKKKGECPYSICGNQGAQRIQFRQRLQSVGNAFFSCSSGHRTQGSAVATPTVLVSCWDIVRDMSRRRISLATMPRTLPHGVCNLPK